MSRAAETIEEVLTDNCGNPVACVQLARALKIAMDGFTRISIVSGERQRAARISETIAAIEAIFAGKEGG